MNDAFGNDLSIGDKVIYSIKNGFGTVYVIGKISSLVPCKSKHGSPYLPPRVSIQVEDSRPKIEFVKNPVLYASNVVLVKALQA